MARYNEFAGPKLPTQLLEKVYGGKVDKHGKRESSRKEKRKAERQAKNKVPLRKKPVKWQAQKAIDSDDQSEEYKTPKSAVPAKDAKPVKSILKRRASPVVDVVKKPVEDEEEDDDDKDDGEDDEEEEETDIDGDTNDELGNDDDEEEEDIMAMDDYTVSRSAAKAKLGDDDAKIAALEKRLGMKGKKSNKVTEDEWDFLINGDDGEDELDDEDIVQSNGKRKRGDVGGKSAADDAWLESKRKKARIVEEKGKGKPKVEPEVEPESDENEEGENETVGDEMDGLANPFSDDEMSADDFDEYVDSDDEEREEEEEQAQPKKRENPYVAPITGDSAPVQKYIPPSLRQAAASDEEVLKQLRRQLQGQLNRLSEANLPSILSAVLELYNSNARQHCTSVLVSLLTNLISDPSVLSDTFLILHAGFSAALYRSLGPDFGAQLLESIVQAFDTHHTDQSSGKQTLNLLAFLSTLYTLQATGHEIIFDYIRMLLANFSEANTELLLRVIRISGPQLRQDDPSALKDIVLILQRETSKIGEAILSVRTKFMVETILNLKNNRVKTGVAAKALSAEHMLRMKKILGGVKGVKTTEPLRITLADIRDSEKKGKWWLVGASWKDPAKHDISSTPASVPATNGHNVSDDNDGDDEGIDLEALAKSQGMNTSVRSALFISITGALDFQHAQLRIGKLKLKNKQMLEIPRVLIHCVGMEGVYNHFYTLVAQLFAADVKMKKAWQFAAYDVFRRLDGDVEQGAGMEVRQLLNVAKMYASLIAEGLLRITILKGLEFAELSAKAKIFVQVLIANVFVISRKNAAAKIGKGKGVEWKARKDGMFEAGVKEIFEQAHAVPDMVLGLQFAIEKVVRGSEAVGPDEKAKRVVEEGCDVAVRALREVPEKRVVFEGHDAGSDSD